MIHRAESNANELVLEIEGDLAGANAQELQKYFDDQLPRMCKILTLEMSKTTSISSSAIGKILLARRKFKTSEIEMRIVGCSDDIYDTLVSLNLDKLMPISK